MVEGTVIRDNDLLIQVGRSTQTRFASQDTLSLCQQSLHFVEKGNEIDCLKSRLADSVTQVYQRGSCPEQNFSNYSYLEDSRVHLLKFKEVDTTMRLAEEFAPKEYYTEALADLTPHTVGNPGAALAFQAEFQSAGRG